MKSYLFEVRDSDGNDCTVYDAIVTAETGEQASERLWAELEEMYPDDESDGGFGTFHACDCACDHFVGNGQTPVVGICEDCLDNWECEHGGLVTNEDGDGEYGPREFDTPEQAMAARAYYHRLIDLSEPIARPTFRMTKPISELCPGCARKRERCTCARWCRECGCVTNHSTRQHIQAEQERDDHE